MLILRRDIFSRSYIKHRVYFRKIKQLLSIIILNPPPSALQGDFKELNVYKS